MIGMANVLAARYVPAVASRFHVEKDDLVGPALLAVVKGRKKMQHAIIDELRRIGGDPRYPTHRTNFVHEQIPPRIVERSEPEGETARIALKRCGVLMVECLKHRQPKKVGAIGGGHRLKPKLRYKIIMLRYWHQLNQTETALYLGLTPSRVAQIEREALGVLREELERRGIKSLRDVV